MNGGMRVTVLGGGSFGTVLANIMAEKGIQVRLWMRDAQQVEKVRQSRENSKPSYATAIAGLALFIVGAQVLRFQGGHAVEPREDFRAFMTAFWVQGVWKSMNKRDLAFDVLLGLALFASAAGEFQRLMVLNLPHLKLAYQKY